MTIDRIMKMTSRNRILTAQGYFWYRRFYYCVDISESCLQNFQINYIENENVPKRKHPLPLFVLLQKGT